MVSRQSCAGSYTPQTGIYLMARTQARKTWMCFLSKLAASPANQAYMYPTFSKAAQLAGRGSPIDGRVAADHPAHNPSASFTSS